MAQEDRDLSSDERNLRASLKTKLLGFAAIERIRWRQKSRLLGIKVNDANTKLFHLRANGRRRKNHIPTLVGQQGAKSEHKEKEKILFDHFQGLLGNMQPRRFCLNESFLELPTPQLQHLDCQVTMEDIKVAIWSLHGEKAAGPDGFIGNFFKACWDLVKIDLLKALEQIFHLKGDTWNLLNTAHLVLIPKKDGAATAGDFRPLSLMHSIAKILCKILANRLGPELDSIVSHSQSAFIKKRCINDNFLFVRNVIKEAHVKRTPMLFMKLDIAKTFDSVHWDYLLEVLRAYGFGQKWRDLVSLILATSSSRVLLNGIPGKPFRHRRGLRQGDPLSPMLFILALDPLQKLLSKATDMGILSPIRNRAACLRVSFYADDAALFINPKQEDIVGVQAILSRFGDISGLQTNLLKTVAYPIRCEQIDMPSLLADFGGIPGNLPCTYLGLPLSIRKPTRAEL